MEGRMMIAILIGLALASNGAASFRPVDYINKDRPTHYADYFNKIENLVEQHGSDDPVDTAKMIRELEQDLVTMKSGFLSPSEDKYDLLGQLGGGQIDLYHRIVERLSWLTLESIRTCEPATVDNYLMAVLQTSNKDLVVFAKDKPAHQSRWQSFLHHYGRSMAFFCYRMSLQTELKQPSGEAVLDTIVSLGDSYIQKYDELAVYKLASKLDFLGGDFDGQRMLESVEKGEVSGNNGLDSAMAKSNPPERFQAILEQACKSIMKEFEEYFTPYNLALVFDEPNTWFPPLRYRKLNEYTRICQGVLRTDTQKELSKNIKRNMPKGRWWTKS